MRGKAGGASMANPDDNCEHLKERTSPLSTSCYGTVVYRPEQLYIKIFDNGINN